MTGHAFCQWLNLYTTMPKILVPVTRLSNSTAATIHKFFMKTTSIFALDLTFSMNWQKS